MAMANIFEQMSRSVSGMSKNASEVNNLRKKIAYERERIQEVMQEIGELYYESQEKELTKLKELCADIDDRKRRIQSMRLELQQMKGKRVCPGCGMQFDENISLHSAESAVQSWTIQLQTKTKKQKRRTAAIISQQSFFLFKEILIKVWRFLFSESGAKIQIRFPLKQVLQLERSTKSANFGRSFPLLPAKTAKQLAKQKEFGGIQR